MSKQRYASGGNAEHQWPEDQWPEDMCPNCVTPWKCNGPHSWGWPSDHNDSCRCHIGICPDCGCTNEPETRLTQSSDAPGGPLFMSQPETDEQVFGPASPSAALDDPLRTALTELVECLSTATPLPGDLARALAFARQCLTERTDR